MNAEKFDEPHSREADRTASVGINTLGSTQALEKASSAQIELARVSFPQKPSFVGHAVKLSGTEPPPL